MDAIFKALNDPARRALLDALRKRDGQSLGELEEVLDMTRFGVMKHLKLLEQAGLIATVKRGRFKYHYLNAVPLQEVIDRWIEPFIAKPLARGMLDLKTHLENPMLDANPKPDFVHQTFIRCTQDALWDALTRAEQMAQYHFAVSAAKGDAEGVGDAMHMLRADGTTMLTQKVLTLDPKSRIEMTFEPDWVNEDKTASRIVFQITAEGPHCKLTCEHYELPESHFGAKEGWARFTASLKSWLETGQPIKMGG